MLQAPYGITYCKRYEPWGMVDRRQMPWFDVRFRGYGRNKIVFTAALNATGFDFEVLFSLTVPGCVFGCALGVLMALADAQTDAARPATGSGCWPALHVSKAVKRQSRQLALRPRRANRFLHSAWDSTFAVVTQTLNPKQN